MTTQLPVYVSLTSIKQNENILLKTLESIIKQTLVPTKIFIYLSTEPYLLDNGFSDKIICHELNIFLEKYDFIKLRWTPNIGPYRKLIPLIYEKWDEDCLIVTLDDDTVYTPNLLADMINHWYRTNCVVGSRIIPLTPPNKILEGLLYSKRLSSTSAQSLYNFHTGKGGVVYHPRYFSRVGRHFFCDSGIFNKYCSTNDDIWFNLIRIACGIECAYCDTPYMSFDNTKHGAQLFSRFNEKGNDIMITATAKFLESNMAFRISTYDL